MGASPEAIAAHADDLRSLSLYYELGELIDLAGEKARIDTARGRIAGVIFERLFAVRADLEPLIERLARKAAEDEARREAEVAEYEAGMGVG